MVIKKNKSDKDFDKFTDMIFGSFKKFVAKKQNIAPDDLVMRDMSKEKFPKGKFYVTTPIYYVNDEPHIGHAYTTIAADVLARYYRNGAIHADSRYYKVFSLTGTDEHGAKIAEAAKSAGLSPKRFCDNLVKKFQATWKNLNISNDYFIRTTSSDHEKFVSDFLLKLNKKKLVYKKKYEGLYCIGCEKFLTDSELVNSKCPDHPNKKPILHSEENWFFSLSKFQKPLLDAIKNNQYQILPETRKNEVVSKIRAGLDDVSISRAGVKWGIPIPWDKKQTTYVWIDALLNYLSALKINKKSKFWPADVQLMAKDILWFHGVIWPALLLAIGEKLPKTIFAHGFFKVNGQKMSKTLGNVVHPNIWVKKYGADAVRYYLLTAFPFGEDGNVSEEELGTKYNSELANELGNLVNRVILMAKKYDPLITKYYQSESCQKSYFGKNPKPDDVFVKMFEELEKSADADDKFNRKLDDFMKDFKFNEALREIWKLIKDANNYIEQTKPWELAKNNQLKKLSEVIPDLVGCRLSVIAYKLKPFLPETAEKILKQLETLKPEVLFPRIDK